MMLLVLVVGGAGRWRHVPHCWSQCLRPVVGSLNCRVTLLRQGRLGLREWDGDGGIVGVGGGLLQLWTGT